MIWALGSVAYGPGWRSVAVRLRSTRRRPTQCAGNADTSKGFYLACHANLVLELLSERRQRHRCRDQEQHYPAQQESSGRRREPEPHAANLDR